MEIKHGVTVTNWDATWTYRPAILVTPASVEDIAAILRDAAQFPSPVRPAGSMHSTARVNGDDGGTLVDMRAMKRIVSITDQDATVEAGASYIEVSRALQGRGLQFHITTEIGNVTLGAMATAATKDSSFPGEYGLVGSYVTGLKYVTPRGEIRLATDRNDPEEMQRLRSSYGLCGIVAEVTIRVRPTSALSVRHTSLTLAEFRERFPAFKSAGGAVMYYLFPYDDRVVVEFRKENPDAEPKAKRIWDYRNRFWRKYGPAITLFIQRSTRKPALRRAADKVHFALLRQALVRIIRSDDSWPHAQIIRYPKDPGANKYLFSMWAFPEAGYFDILGDYFAFCRDYAARTGFRCDLPNVGYAIAADRRALLSYCWDSSTLSIDPASTGGDGWGDFLRAYNGFCSARGGVPLPNQTPHLTATQMSRAFGDRLVEFELYRRQCDPDDRMLDSYFRELLSEAQSSAAPQRDVIARP